MFKPFIAIGHGLSTDGSWDTGCTWNGYTEAALAKEVVAGILEVFDKNGKQYVTDYPENDMNIVNCVAEANRYNCSHYLSVHLDWDQAPSGIYPIYLSSDGLHMANCIRASMKLRIPGLNDRGNLMRADYEVNNTNMPAVIMEIGSIKADNTLIRNNTKLFGHAIAYGLMDAAGESYKAVEETTSTPVTAPPAGTPQPEKTVTSSGYNWDTEDIQYFLNICNYGAPDIDGITGPETTNCIKNAQRAYGITVDGIWGSVIQAHAEKQIRQYQTRLLELGHNCGEVDGIAGPSTFQAVKNFQMVNGLTIDGIVGEETFKKLFDPTATPYKEKPLELKNFEPDEFKCACGCGGDVAPELKLKVQQLRDRLTQKLGSDTPLVITSGFRCPTQNARDGGVANSKHMIGHACDLYAQGKMSSSMVDTIAQAGQEVGLGTLRYHENLFVHVQLEPADEIMN